jgi:hypothetical protein
MVTQTGSTFVDALNSKVQEFEAALAGVTEEEAGQPLDGDWTIRHVLSHLLDFEGPGLAARLRRFIDEDTPALDVNVDDPAYTPARQEMSYAQLLDAVREQYADFATFLEGCTEEQFSRRARLPEYFKASPLTDTPTLAQWSMGLIQFHLAAHIAQIREHRSRQEA